MAKSKKLAPGSDPIWQQESFRKNLFRRVYREKSLTREKVAHLTGNSVLQVEQWHAPSGRVIPVATLRALLYDLDAV